MLVSVHEGEAHSSQSSAKARSYESPEDNEWLERARSRGSAEANVNRASKKALLFRADPAKDAWMVLYWDTFQLQLGQ